MRLNASIHMIVQSGGVTILIKSRIGVTYSSLNHCCSNIFSPLLEIKILQHEFYLENLLEN